MIRNNNKSCKNTFSSIYQETIPTLKPILQPHGADSFSFACCSLRESDGEGERTRQTEHSRMRGRYNERERKR